MNQIMDIEDFKRPEWKSVLAEMHSLMNIKRTNLEKFPHCTDRRNLFEKAEIESFKHWEYPWMIKHSKLKSGQKILDCGCGRGFLQFYLARKGMKVTSLDVSTLKPKFVRKFWKFCEDKKIPLSENKTITIPKIAKRYDTNVEFHVLNIAKLPFNDNSYDCVYSISVLEHMEKGDDEDAIREMARVLKPGGRMLVTVDFSPIKIPRVSYDAKDIERLINISGLEQIGESCDYQIKNWAEHKKQLKDTFLKVDVSVSTAGFVLQKKIM